MIQSGKHFEGIIEMLNNFRSEVKSLSSLGYLNINKYAENFLKRILNFVFELELENLNDKKYNFPGLDLGDEDESIAFQITATKKSGKIDNTLQTCLDHKHYETFKKIKVLVLTSKQNSYTLKTITEPNFTFNPNSDILDFDDLYKIIENFDPRKMKALFEFLQQELQPTLKALNSEEDDSKILLEVEEGTKETKLKYFFKFKMNIEIVDQKVSPPNIHTNYDSNLKSTDLRNKLLPIFYPQFRKSNTNREILFEDKLSPSAFSNFVKGKALLIEESKIQMELVGYSDQETFLVNLQEELIGLVANLLLLKKSAKGEYQLKITISMESNTTILFHPTNSIVLQSVFNTYALENPFNYETIVDNVRIGTLISLIQDIMHGFVCKEEHFKGASPFLTIDTDITSKNINEIKRLLNENDYTVL